MDYGMVSSVGGVVGSIITTNAANHIAADQAKTQAYIRGKNNEVIAEENKRDAILTGIQRWRQSIYNKRVVQNAASDQEMLTTNFNRQRDARARGNFAEQVQYAEQAGRMQAQAAASGVTGSVVDVLNMTLRMKKGQEDTQYANTTAQLARDEATKEFSTYWSDMDRQDTSIIFDNPRMNDYGVSAPQQRSLISGVSLSDIKTVAQGVGSMNFSFNSPPTTDWGNVDYQATRDN
jgi:hypothetical protein